MTQDEFSSLVKDLLKASGSDIDEAQLADMASFTFKDDDQFECVVCPHSEENQVLIEVVVDKIDLSKSTSDFDRLLVLHKLNSNARLGTQIIASVNEDDELIVSKLCESHSLDGVRLAEEMNSTLDAAAHLKSIWNKLSELESSPLDNKDDLPPPLFNQFV